MKKRAEIAFHFLPVLFTFLMPFGGFLSVLLVLWFISSWWCIDKVKFRSGLKNKWFLLMLAFFVMHCISGLLSDNLREGITGIEKKLSFLAFPYFFFLFNIKPDIIKKMVVGFVSGCFFALLACLIRSTFVYVISGNNEFFYSAFSYFIHGSCFSMYLLFGILILIFVYPLWFSGDKWLNVIRYFFVFAFLTGIFLCASKMGYIAALLILLMVPFFKFRDKLNIKTISISLVVLVATLYAALNFFPKPFERINNALTTVSSDTIDRTSGESTAVRLLIWKESREVIRQNLLFGVGIGDVDGVLQERYKQQGLTGALEHNLNAHNEYFQTTMGLGIAGGVLLIILTLGVLLYGVVQRRMLLNLFSIIIILNFLVESMLQRQDGNLFFVFFLCLLLQYDNILKKA